MAHAFSFAVAHKMVVAVAVKGVFVQQKFRNVVGAALAAPLGQFRAFGPALVAVHEDFFILGHRPGQRRHSIFQRSGRQVSAQMHSPLPYRNQCCTVIASRIRGRAPMQFRHIRHPLFCRAAVR